jgi:Na+-driven multidrug efflux pump
VFNALDAYLQTQEVVVPQMLIALLFVGVNLGLNWLLVHGGGHFGGLGFIGSPIATSLSTVFQLVALLIVMRRRTSKPNPWPVLFSGLFCSYFLIALSFFVLRQGWTSKALSKFDCT